MTEAVSVILGVALGLQAILLFATGVIVFCECAGSRADGIEAAKSAAKWEAALVGATVLALAIAYGIQLHLAAWN
jgi:hypothetical protein